MTLSRTVYTYYRLSQLTKANMHVRKTEFLAEVCLSLFVLTIALENPKSASYAIAAIAIIHSFNVARLMEAYTEAQYQSNQDPPENYR